MLTSVLIGLVIGSMINANTNATKIQDLEISACVKEQQQLNKSDYESKIVCSQEKK